MVGPRGRRAARIAAVALGFAALVWSLVAVLVTAFPDSPLLGARGIAVILGATVLFGLAADRWWACALPLAWTAPPVIVMRIVDLVTGDCSVCGGDRDWSNYPLIILLVEVVPLTIALVVGVAMRRAVDRWASTPPPQLGG